MDENSNEKNKNQDSNTLAGTNGVSKTSESEDSNQMIIMIVLGAVVVILLAMIVVIVVVCIKNKYRDRI